MSSVIEGLGLVLAILDFTRFSRKLEQVIDDKRAKYRKWLEDQSADNILARFQAFSDQLFKQSLLGLLM